MVSVRAGECCLAVVSLAAGGVDGVDGDAKRECASGSQNELEHTWEFVSHGHDFLRVLGLQSKIHVHAALKKIPRHYGNKEFAWA